MSLVAKCLTRSLFRRQTMVLLGGTCIALSILVTLHTCYFTWKYFSSTPFWDFWNWLADYRTFLDGNYTFKDLVKPHNEHRIFTARVLLFIDARLFHMTGHFVAVVNLLILAFIGFVLGCLGASTEMSRRRRCVMTLTFVALMLSVCQWQNLLLPFDVQIALMGFWLTLSAALLVKATAPAASRRAISWSIIAGLCYCLAAFSMAGGLLELPWLILLLLLRKAATKPAIIFSATAGLGAALFLMDYHPVSAAPIVLSASLPTVLRLVIFASNFLGCAFYAFDDLPLVFGLFGTICFVAVLMSALHSRFWLRASVSAGAAALLTIAGSILLIACAAAATRSSLGISGAIEPRYTTPSLIFCCSVLLLVFDALAQRLSTRARLAALHVAKQLIATLCLVTLNFAPRYTEDASAFSSNLVSEGVSIRNNVYVPSLLRQVYYGKREEIVESAAELEARHLAVFADKVTNTFLPPPDVASAHLAPIAVCRGYIDLLYRLDDTRAVLRGWMTSDIGRTADWIRLETPDGQTYATVPATEYRSDVARALGRREAKGVYSGFEGPYQAQVREMDLHAYGLFSAKPDLNCRLPGTIHMSSITVQLLSDVTQARPVPLMLGSAFRQVFEADDISSSPFRRSSSSVDGALSSARSGDGFKVSFSIKSRALSGNDVLVPYCAPAETAGLAVELLLGNDKLAKMSLPAETDGRSWYAIRIPGALLFGSPSVAVSIIINDIGGRSGTGITVARPILARPLPEAGRLLK